MDIKKNLESLKTVTTVTTTITTEVTAAPAGDAVTTPAATSREATDTASTEATAPSASSASTADNGTPIDRSNEKLIDNTTTFNALLRILAMNPDVLTNAKAEAEEREAEEKEEKLRVTLGADYDLVFDKKKVNTGKSRRPGVRQLRLREPRIAVMEVPRNGICEVYVNGYAVYDNGNRRVVIWVPDCGVVTYYFAGLIDKEKEYLAQSNEIGMDVLGELPWYDAILLAGEERIQYNMDHPKSRGNTSDADFDDAPPAASWAGATRFPNPEQAYLEKEAAEERRKALTEKQREAYELYYEQGYTQREIANDLGISHNAISARLNYVNNTFKDNPQKFFKNL